MSSLARYPVYPELLAHREAWRGRHLRQLFAADPGRFDRLSLEVEELFFDYSKNLVTGETMSLLVRLAEEAGVPAAVESMFRGERINRTEGRAALHVALRNRLDWPILVDGEDVMPAVRDVLARMRGFCDALAGGWRGHTGERVTDVVNIGIGGSDLGPKMVAEALKPYWRPGLRAHFVSNVDGAQLADTVAGLRPETTLFIVASKTFTTQETLANALSARRWLLAALGDESAVGRHFAAVSTNRVAAAEFGVDPRAVFEFWDWVGGRYSTWSAVGLAVACVVGMDRFEEFLAGGQAMDEHFRTAPPAANMPVVMALLGLWYIGFFDAHAQAILPYDQSLSRFAAHLQQLDMESNGKAVDLDGRRVEGHTGPVVFGEPGTNGQHAFYQLIHQGTRLVPADFIACANPHHSLAGHHEMLLANYFAQTEALMRGKSEDEARADLETAGRSPREIAALLPHKVFDGNRPTNSILLPKLTPRSLGQLLAAYEHKVFVQGVVWRVNSFDQWGVELGKELAGRILPELEGDGDVDAHDASTNGLLRRYKRWRR